MKVGKVAKVFSIVCDDCGSGRGVQRYELRTPDGKYVVDLCSKHGKAMEAQFGKLAPEGPQPSVGRAKRKVFPIDPETGEPIVE